MTLHLARVHAEIDVVCGGEDEPCGQIAGEELACHRHAVGLLVVVRQALEANAVGAERAADRVEDDHVVGLVLDERAAIGHWRHWLRLLLVVFVPGRVDEAVVAAAAAGAAKLLISAAYGHVLAHVALGRHLPHLPRRHALVVHADYAAAAATESRKLRTLRRDARSQLVGHQLTRLTARAHDARVLVGHRVVAALARPVAQAVGRVRRCRLMTTTTTTTRAALQWRREGETLDAQRMVGLTREREGGKRRTAHHSTQRQHVLVRLEWQRRTATTTATATVTATVCAHEEGTVAGCRGRGYR